MVNKIGILSAAILAAAVRGEDAIPTIPTYELSNGVKLPFVGMGIGNLPHELLESAVTSGLQSALDIRLIDTAHASRNEGELLLSSLMILSLPLIL